MASYFLNRTDGVFAKHEGALVYIWDPSVTQVPAWLSMPDEIITHHPFEPFHNGTEAEFTERIKAIAEVESIQDL